MAVFLRRLSRWQAEQQREAVADLYAAAYRGAPGGRSRDRQEFLHRFEQHGQHDGFDMAVADEGGLVGCAYVFRLGRGLDAWAGVPSDVLPGAEELASSGRVFALAELMVLPAYRRQGVATRLAELMLYRLAADLVVARVEDRAGDGFRELLRAWGWKELSGPDGTDAPDGASGPAGPAGSSGAAGTEVWARVPQR
ncbi:GNAT family N-acetyltransferase [Streptomyces sp. SID14478]|uniref:GNAT family N-acetyltransferase n=1 Tax=Streptomyces sp. SID14478 TaxID=2706073 RepID=UPI0013DB336A|nr:GNAT family N-acetyltransferase [Streptomyces sp. SID14478]NEB75466.1 GNAT family N-acetyltransferase [Streptomyces sp. SID14478]